MSADLPTVDLPTVRGSYLANAPLAELTWFRVGGAADVIYKPADLEDLQDFLRAYPNDLPLSVLGAGSNLLVRDGGVRGVVIKLGKGFGDVREMGGCRLRVGAAVPDLVLARAAAKAGISGLEFYRGIPGTVGGALAMNGGAYGCDTACVLVEARAVDRDGVLHHLSNADMGFGYRHNGIDPRWIFVDAVFAGVADAPADIEARMEAISEARTTTQPIKSRTGGSTFKNPAGQKAWALIDAAGCRGLRNGDAQVSEQHCNFLINHGKARASDIELLGETIRARVVAQSGVALDWEIRRIGEEVAQ